jgi:hypothetical protein
MHLTARCHTISASRERLQQFDELLHFIPTCSHEMAMLSKDQ